MLQAYGDPSAQIDGAVNASKCRTESTTAFSSGNSTTKLLKPSCIHPGTSSSSDVEI